MAERQMSERSEDETPQIGETLSAFKVIENGYEVEPGVYELEVDGHNVRAELKEAVITGIGVTA